jgi:hypothetical protein
MAKRKLTAKQRKARKRASYYKSEYKKNVEAIQFLQRFGIDMPIIKEPKKITKSSLNAVRKIYEQTKRKIDKYDNDYVDITTGEVYAKLPTKAEAVKIVKEEKEQVYIPFDPYEQYIEDLKAKIEMLSPLRDSDKTEKNYQKNVVPKQENIKKNFLQAIDDAIAKYGQEKVAETLAQNQYMQKIGNLDEKYTYQIVEDMTDGDDGLLVLMDASVDAALLSTEAY